MARHQTDVFLLRERARDVLGSDPLRELMPTWGVGDERIYITRTFAGWWRIVEPVMGNTTERQWKTLTRVELRNFVRAGVVREQILSRQPAPPAHPVPPRKVSLRALPAFLASLRQQEKDSTAREMYRTEARKRAHRKSLVHRI